MKNYDILQRMIIEAYVNGDCDRLMRIATNLAVGIDDKHAGHAVERLVMSISELQREYDNAIAELENRA